VSEVVGFGQLLEKIYISQCRSTKMEDMELLKAMKEMMGANLKEIKEDIKSNQEKTEAKRKAGHEALKEMIDANQEDLLPRLEARIESNRETDREERKAERKAYQEYLMKIMEEMLGANQDKMDAWITEKQDNQKETTTYQKATEANPEKLNACQETTTCHAVMKADAGRTEPDPRMMQSIGEHEEVRKEEAVVMQVEGLRKRYRDWNLAAGHRQKPKGRIQASCESQNRLTVAGRKVSRRIRVA
jgi:hypothetical protein